MSDDLRPRNARTGEVLDISLTEDLARVLAHTVVGWEPILGVDLSESPNVKRVLARYRQHKAASTAQTPIAWTSPDGILNMQQRRDEGRSWYSPQCRVDRPDDYNTVPLYLAVSPESTESRERAVLKESTDEPERATEG